MPVFTMKNKVLIIFISLLAIVILVCVVNWLFVLRKAHNTFENYYAFRGCVQLLDRADDYGTCRTASGQVIKIIKLQNKWYLEGDGPGVW
jgi:hypothetical protein